MKNIFYALAAVALVGFVGCTKDQGYTPGGDIQGEQIYIDNSTSTFYVKTAAEKEEEAAELEKLSRGLQAEPEAFEDDTQIELKVVRKGGNGAEYTTSVEISAASAKELALFTLPADAVAKEGAATTMVVPVTFAEGVNEATIAIGFDIAALATSYEYEFNATVADENTTYYGASSFDFVITHMINFEFPYTDIGTITLNYDHIWTGNMGMPEYSGIKIQLHNDDYKALAAGEKLSYMRLLIPKLMYQLAAASVEAGDGFFEEGDLEYYAECNSISLAMTPDYNMAMDQAVGNEKYPHPALVNEPAKYPLFAMAGLDAYGAFYWRVGTPSENLSWVSEHITSSGMEIGMLFGNTFSCTFSRTANVFTYNTAYYLENLSSWFGVNPFTFTWDTNDLEADWANYFKVDYIKDIDYAKVAGAGTYTSKAFLAADGTAQSWAQDIYVGMDSSKGKQVYFLPNIYSTSTAEQVFGLAMHVEGESLTVIEGQPTGLTVMGKALFASQSSKIESAAEYTADGALKKLTIGLALSFEDGTVLGEYEEVYEFNSAAAGIDAFCGNFELFTTEIYSPYYGDDGKPTTPKLSAFTADVTIVKDGDAGKVKIYGLDAGYWTYYAGASGYVVGEYDAVQNAIVVPAQFFQGLGFVNLGDGAPYVGYFQPGHGSYGAYNTSSGPKFISELGATAESCALVYGANGVLTMTSSATEPTAAFVDSYALDLYTLSSSYEWEYYTNMTTTFGNGGKYAPTLTPATAGGDEGAETAALKKGVASAKAIEARAAKAARTAKVKKAISLNKVINVEALVK